MTTPDEILRKMLDEDEPREAASTQRTARKRPPTKGSWRPGQSGNPAGRKPSGQCWAEVFKALTDKTADELAAEVGGPSTWLGNMLSSFPPGVPLRDLVALRVLVALMIGPSAGLLNALIKSELPVVPDDIPSTAEQSDSSEEGESETEGSTDEQA